MHTASAPDNIKNKIPQLKQRLENFLDSDSGYATATKVVFALLATGAIFAVATMAPNTLQLLGMLSKKHKRSARYTKQQLKNAFDNLRRRNFIEVLSESDEKLKVRITKRGETKIMEMSLDTLFVPKPKHWDGKWRVVIFDIPDRFKRAREALRSKLKDLNFHQLQKSVWLHPYPCEDEIIFVAKLFVVEPFIEIFTAENFFNETKEYKLKRIFEL